MDTRSALEAIEKVILIEIDKRSVNRLWRKDRHDIVGAYDDCNNPRFDIRIMPGVSNDLMIKCSSGSRVTYFIYGLSLPLLGITGRVGLSDPEFWKSILDTISRTFNKAFHFSSLEAGVNRVLSLNQGKVKGQKYKFDIDEIIPLISSREVFIQSVEVKVIAKDKRSKNEIELTYHGSIPFLRDIENEARIKLSQMRFYDDYRNELEIDKQQNEEKLSNQESVTREESNQDKTQLIEFYKPSWPVIRHPLFE